MWKPASNPPPFTVFNGVYEKESSPVLCYDKWGEMRVCIYFQYDDDEEPSWKTTDSEGWDYTGKVLFWMELPEKPGELSHVE